MSISLNRRAFSASIVDIKFCWYQYNYTVITVTSNSKFGHIPEKSNLRPPSDIEAKSHSGVKHSKLWQRWWIAWLLLPYNVINVTSLETFIVGSMRLALSKWFTALQSFSDLHLNMLKYIRCCKYRGSSLGSAVDVNAIILDWCLIEFISKVDRDLGNRNVSGFDSIQGRFCQF